MFARHRMLDKVGILMRGRARAYPHDFSGGSPAQIMIPWRCPRLPALLLATSRRRRST